MLKVNHYLPNNHRIKDTFLYLFIALFFIVPCARDQNFSDSSNKKNTPDTTASQTNEVQSVAVLKFPNGIDFKKMGAPLWRGIKPSERFRFYMAADFEDAKLWNIQSVNGDTLARLVRQEPVSQPPSSTDAFTWQDHFYTDLFYTMQSALIDKRPPPAKPQYSLEILWRVQRPGEENINIVPPHPSSLRHQKEIYASVHARALEISLWCKANSKKQSLYALFYTSKGNVQKVKIGSLDFQGWRRLQAKLPLHINQFRKGKDRNPWFHFAGLQVSTDKSERPGFYSLLVDQVVILADGYFSHYAGEKIQDDWQ